MEISLIIHTLVIQFYTGVLNIPLEGSVSRFFIKALVFIL